MGGKIQVQSQPEQGSIYFPFNIKAKASVQSVRTYVHNSMWELEGKSVLVVDDNSLNRDILFGQLTQWKLIPVLASSGKEST